MRRESWLQRILLILAAVGLATGLADPGLAQTDRDERQTQLQQDTETSVRIVCGGFVQDFGSPDNPALTPQQSDLFRRCREMVHSSNDLDGREPDAFSLDLTEEELNGAYQNLAGEEAINPGTMSTEIQDVQLANIARRLAAVRRGASGFSVVDLGFATDSGVLQASRLGLGPSTEQPRGGAASADSAGPERWGVFINGIFGFGDKDGTDNEDGFEFDTAGVTAGADIRLDNNVVLGGALGYGSMETTFDDTATGTVTGGGVDADGLGAALYLTKWWEKLYLDGVISYGQNGYDFERSIRYPTVNRTATADTDGDLWSATLGFGYDVAKGGWTYGPYLRASAFQLDIDGYTEHGAGGLELEVDKQEVESLLSMLGLQVAYAASKSWGVLLPQGRIGWNHEFQNDSRVIIARYLNDPSSALHPLVAFTDEPDRDFFPVSLALVFALRGGTQLFINYDTLIDLDDITNHTFTLGGRFAL